MADFYQLVLLFKLNSPKNEIAKERADNPEGTVSSQYTKHDNVIYPTESEALSHRSKFIEDTLGPPNLVSDIEYVVKAKALTIGGV